MLDERIECLGADVALTHEPGGTPFGMRIREILKTEPNISLKSQFHLVEAQRTHHVNTFIKPALERGYTVICDRFIDTSYAYQHDYMTEDQWKDYIENYEVVPDITFLLYSSNVKGLKERADRKNEELDHFDNESIEKLQRKQDLFYDLAIRYGKRIKAINADLDKQVIHEYIWECYERCWQEF